MKIIWEDEHYIYEETSNNWDSVVIRKTEKPQEQRLARRIDTWVYILTPISTSKSFDDIYSVHFIHKEVFWFQWNYDFKLKKFEDWFKEDLRLLGCWTDEDYAEYTENLKEHIEGYVDMYWNIEEKIEKLKEQIEERKKLISTLEWIWADVSDLKSELIEMYDLFAKFQEILKQS